MDSSDRASELVGGIVVGGFHCLHEDAGFLFPHVVAREFDHHSDTRVETLVVGLQSAEIVDQLHHQPVLLERRQVIGIRVLAVIEYDSRPRIEGLFFDLDVLRHALDDAVDDAPAYGSLTRCVLKFGEQLLDGFMVGSKQRDRIVGRWALRAPGSNGPRSAVSRRRSGEPAVQSCHGHVLGIPAPADFHASEWRRSRYLATARGHRRVSVLPTSHCRGLSV